LAPHGLEGAMLHLVNGEAAVGTMRRSSLPGEFLAWPEMLSEGPPVDAGRRADFMAQHHLAPWERFLAAAAGLPEQLRKAGAHDEVVLWFEDACWFCQANLLGILGGPFAAQLQPRKLTLVLRGGPMGGAQTPAQYEREFAKRAAVGEPLRALAGKSWTAYASDDPRDLERLEDFTAWPLLRDGLRAHLARFPSTFNGLSSLETALLKQLEAGPATFATMFPKLRDDAAVRALGLGDTQAMAALWGLVKARVPLASTRAPAPGGSLEALRGAQFEITATGKAVLRGAEDHVRLNGVDRWLGGVELLGRGPVWRWDPLEGRLKPP
jgi:hypothetical protein